MHGTYRVISADSHVNPQPFFWDDYLPAHLKDHAPKLESTPEGDFISYAGEKAPFSLLGSVAGARFEDFKAKGDFKELLRVSRPGGWDPAERLKDMDEDRVDAEVLYGGGPLSSTDPEFCLATFRAYNDWLADFCSYAPDRLIGIAYIPTWDVDVAIVEARRAHRKGLRGVLIPAYPPIPPAGVGMFQGTGEMFLSSPASGVSYSGREFEPFWATLVELGMAAHIHLGARLVPIGTPPPPSSFMTHLTVGKLFMAHPIADAIFSGLFQRFPDLKLVTVESGIGWAAFLVELMDRNWERHRFHTESVLTEPPSSYFKRNIKGTFLHDPVAIRERDLIGVGNILWSSDYPHSDTSWPNSLQVIEAHLAGIPEDERRKIAGENAAKLYNIRVGATA